MAERRRRRGIFEGLPRALYRRTGARYFDASAAGIVFNGVVVAGFGVLTLVLYVDVSSAELALFAACSVAGYVAEGLVAGAHLRRAAAPVSAWLAGARPATTRRRRGRLRRSCPQRSCAGRSLYAVGAAGAAAASLVLAALLDLPASRGAAGCCRSRCCSTCPR